MFYITNFSNKCVAVFILIYFDCCSFPPERLLLQINLGLLLNGALLSSFKFSDLKSSTHFSCAATCQRVKYFCRFVLQSQVPTQLVMATKILLQDPNPILIDMNN